MALAVPLELVKRKILDPPVHDKGRASHERAGEGAELS